MMASSRQQPAVRQEHHGEHRLMRADNGIAPRGAVVRAHDLSDGGWASARASASTHSATTAPIASNVQRSGDPGKGGDPAGQQE